MGNTIDSIPVLSQAKSLGQVISGNAKGAKATQENFAFENEVPMLFPPSIVLQAIGGNRDKDLNRVIGSISAGGQVKGTTKFVLPETTRKIKATTEAAKVTTDVTGGPNVGVVGGAVGVGVGLGVGVAVGTGQNGQGQQKDKEEKEKNDKCNAIVSKISRVPNDGPPAAGDQFRDQVEEFRNTECRYLEGNALHQAVEGQFQHLTNVNPGNPVQNVYLLPNPRDVHENGLPVMLHAELTRAGCPRTNFAGTSWLARMRFMGARENRPHNLDRRGHLLASQLCGPVMWYNLAPQTARVNNNIGGAGTPNAWTNMEEGLRSFFANRCGTVRWNVHLLYNTRQNQQRQQEVASTRPRAFKTCVLFRRPDNRPYAREIGIYSDNSR